MIKVILAIAIIFVLTLFTGCYDQILDVRVEDNVGLTVRTHGELQSTVDIGTESGYYIKDDLGNSIIVLSDSTPSENSYVLVKGTLVSDTLYGYYVSEDSRIESDLARNILN